MEWVARLQRRVFLTDRVDPSPIVLTQRRIFILPSRTGLLFALVLVVMYSGAVNYNLGLGHALVFLLASLGHTGLIHSFRNLLGLRVQPGRAPPVFAGETASFSLRLENSREQPRPGLRLRHGKTGAAVDFDLPAATVHAVRVPVAAPQRGWLRLERLTLSTGYPLGFFYAWSHPQPAMRCLVYPRPLVYPLPPEQGDRRPGRHGSAAGDDDFIGLKTREPGDSPRHIAWKSYARDPEHRPLMVKRFAGGNEPETWFDWHELPAKMDTETRLSVLTGWVVAAEEGGRRYGLRLPGTTLLPARGDAHSTACLRALALFGRTDDDDE